jgi:hypothetical protein
MKSATKVDITAKSPRRTREKEGGCMFRKLLTIAAVGCSLIWAQQGNVIYPVAQQNLDAYLRDQWNKGSGTRTDMKPSDFLPKDDNTATEVNGGVCVGLGALGTGIRGCMNDEGPVSLSASVLGGHAQIYANPMTGDMGGGVGLGGPLVEVGPLSVAASADLCGDKDKGLVIKTAVGAGPAQVTTTTYDKNR